MANSCQVMSGNGLVMTPKPFETPSDEEADIMQENIDPYGCCSGCHNTLDGPYYQTSSVSFCVPANQSVNMGEQRLSRNTQHAPVRG